MGDKELTIVIRARNEAAGALAGVTQAVDQATSKMSGGWDRTVGASQKFAAGIAVAGAAAVGFGVASVGAFMESEAVMAQTEAVIKSTGGAAGVTAQQVSQMASAFQQTTTFSDEAVQAGENMLLTFTNIGSTVFPQATQTMLDMSTALGQDTTQSAMMLGKALNDPVQGVTALRRVGVQLTDQQEQQVKAMVAAGDVAGAQGVILQELQKEFGGSAAAAGATFGGQLKILWNLFNDGMEVVGGFIAGAISPLVSALVNWTAGEGLYGVMDKIAAAIQRLQPYLPMIAGAIIGGLVPAFIALAAATWSAMAPILPFLAAGAAIAAIVMVVVNSLGGWGKVMSMLKPIFDTVMNGIKSGLQSLQPVFAAVGNFVKAFGEFLAAGLKGIIPVVVQVAGVVGPILGTAFKVIAQVVGVVINVLAGVLNFLKPLAPVILAIGAAVLAYFIAPWLLVVAAIIAAIVVFKLIWSVISFVFNAILAIVSAVVGFIVSFIIGYITMLFAIWSAIFNAIWAVIQFVWSAIVLYITTYINIVRAVITAVINGVQAVWNSIWNAIKAVAQAVWAGIVAVVTTYINIVRSVIQTGINIVLGIWNTITRIVGVVAGALGSVVSTISGGISRAVSTVTGFIGQFVSAGKDLIEGIVRGLSPGAIIDKIKSVIGDAIGFAKKLLGIGSPSKVFMQFGRWMMEGMANGIEAGAGAVQSALDGALPTEGYGISSSLGVGAGAAGMASGATTNNRTTIINVTQAMTDDDIRLMEERRRYAEEKELRTL